MPSEPSPAEEDNRAPPSSTSGGVVGEVHYEAPRLTVLGTLTDLTRGHSNVETDGIGIGSIFAR